MNTPRRRSVAPPKPATTIVIDQDNARRDAVCDALEDAGYDPIAVRTFGDGLRAARTGPIERILVLHAQRADEHAMIDAHASDPKLRAVSLVFISADVRHIGAVPLESKLRAVLEGFSASN